MTTMMIDMMINQTTYVAHFGKQQAQHIHRKQQFLLSILFLFFRFLFADSSSTSSVIGVAMLVA
jgi:hypothetical protein